MQGRAAVAVEYGGPENIRVIDVEVPEPAPDQVRVHVVAAGVNPADAKQARGLFGRGGTPPIRLGSELAGVVTAVGDAVGDVAVGDEVVAFRAAGAWASDVLVKAVNVFAKPPSLPFDAAAGLLLTGVTAWHLLEATGVGEGDVVLVHGASGSVGLAVVQLARLRGATVVGTASHRNLPLVRRFGGIGVVYGSGLEHRVLEAVPERRIDVALDTVGTDEAVDVSLALVDDRRRIATIAAFERGGDAGILLLGGGPGADPGTAVRAAARGELVRLAGEGLLRVELGRAFPLDDAAEAMRLVESGHPGGKLVLRP
jgi:NADPH:quinone reductase